MIDPITKKESDTMKKLTYLYAVHPETGEEITCCLDLTKLEESDRLFRQFTRFITHRGYALCGVSS